MKINLLPTAVFCCAGLLLNAQPSPWVRCSEGLPNATVYSLAAIGDTLFCGTQNQGVFISKDGAQHWTPMPPASPSFGSLQVWTMTALDTFVFAGVRGGSAGIYRSSVNGSSWTVANTGLSNHFIHDLLAVGDRLFANTWGGGVFVSEDRGDHWALWKNGNGMEDNFGYSLAANSTHFFAGTQGRNIIPDTGVAYRMLWNDAGWERINNGFARNGVHLEQVFSMAANDSLVFAGTDDVGLYRSDDLGSNWQRVLEAPGDVHAIQIACHAVYMGTSFAGTQISLDDGKTWQPNNAGIALGPSTSPSLVKDFLVKGDFIYVATDLGVFKQALPAEGLGCDAVTNVLENNALQYTVQLSPNPTNHLVSIENATGEALQYSLFDVFGRTHRTGILVEISNEMDISQLAPGTYFLSLAGVQNRVCRKLVITR